MLNAIIPVKTRYIFTYLLIYLFIYLFIYLTEKPI